jgi:hypothetical protein
MSRIRIHIKVLRIQNKVTNWCLAWVDHSPLELADACGVGIQHGPGVAIDELVQQLQVPKIHPELAPSAHTLDV